MAAKWHPATNQYVWPVAFAAKMNKNDKNEIQRMKSMTGNITNKQSNEAAIDL